LKGKRGRERNRTEEKEGQRRNTDLEDEEVEEGVQEGHEDLSVEHLAHQLYHHLIISFLLVGQSLS
jgi:hypothetical protein